MSQELVLFCGPTCQERGFPCCSSDRARLDRQVLPRIGPSNTSERSPCTNATPGREVSVDSELRAADKEGYGCGDDPVSTSGCVPIFS